MTSLHQAGAGASARGPAPDDALVAVRRFQAGDRDGAFRILFDRYHRPLLRFFARKGAAPDLCSDLTQETFLGVHKGLDDWSPDARFETWLYRIALNAFLKHRRAAGAVKRSAEEVPADAPEAPPLPADDDDPLDELLASESHARLHDALETLPPQMRRCLMLRLEREASYREIATLLRLSVDTVKSHLRQGRRRLRQVLGEPQNEPPSTTQPREQRMHEP